MRVQVIVEETRCTCIISLDKIIKSIESCADS